jgi:hypothetical protein
MALIASFSTGTELHEMVLQGSRAEQTWVGVGAGSVRGPAWRRGSRLFSTEKPAREGAPGDVVARRALCDQGQPRRSSKKEKMGRKFMLDTSGPRGYWIASFGQTGRPKKYEVPGCHEVEKSSALKKKA